jgi:hypothetical protein
MSLPRETSSADFLSWLLDRVERAEATSFVRYGDGEAQVMTASCEVALKRLLNLQGPPKLNALQLEKLRLELVGALQGADAVGLMVKARQGNVAYANIMTGFVAHVEREHLVKHDQLVVQNNVHLTCLASQLDVLVNGRDIGLISCRDVAEVLRQRGAATVCHYPIPSEFSLRVVDRAFERQLHGQRHYPEVFAQLKSQLEVEPGQVFLIGAGPLGKVYCQIVKERGGIGIDLGSVLDNLADKITRGPNKGRVIE